MKPRSAASWHYHNHTTVFYHKGTKLTKDAQSNSRSNHTKLQMPDYKGPKKPPKPLVKFSYYYNILCEFFVPFVSMVVNCPVVGSTLLRKNKPRNCLHKASNMRPEARLAEELPNQPPAVPSAHRRAAAAAGYL